MEANGPLQRPGTSATWTGSGQGRSRSSSPYCLIVLTEVM